MICTREEAIEILEDFDPSESTIDDIISECADSAIDVYNKDRWDWALAGDNIDLVEEAINAHGWEGAGKSIVAAIGVAQYEENRRRLAEAWEEMKSEKEEE